jgi:hypothetical protein
MLSSYWLFVPFILQMVCMAADEFRFHRKRGLPRWERIGHPLDTLTVVACLVWILCVPPGRRAVTIFVLLAVFSCVFVTKDEPVHRSRCCSAEQWLHALLFMLHPVVLASAGFLWPGSSPGIVRFSGSEGTFLELSLLLMVGFGIYQFVFWNFVWHRKKAAR